MKGHRLEQVVFYDDGGVTGTVDMKEITGYLREKLGRVTVVVRRSPFQPYPEKSLEYARRLAELKILDPRKKQENLNEPLYGEIQYENRRIDGLTGSFGVLYDGFRLQRIYTELIPKAERQRELMHIVLTNRLFATWDDNDLRYHARTSIYGFPSVISNSGIVEAPAKPKEYYLMKQQYEALGKDPLELQEKFRGRFIDYDDERLTEVMKGYIMQTIFYHLTDEPFCADRRCRLFNAHWQEELIRAQIESGELCQQHQKFLETGELS